MKATPECLQQLSERVGFPVADFPETLPLYCKRLPLSEAIAQLPIGDHRFIAHFTQEFELLGGWKRSLGGLVIVVAPFKEVDKLRSHKAISKVMGMNKSLGGVLRVTPEGAVEPVLEMGFSPNLDNPYVKGVDEMELLARFFTLSQTISEELGVVLVDIPES